MDKKKEYKDRLKAIVQMIEKVNEDLEKIKKNITLTQNNNTNDQLR